MIRNKLPKQLANIADNKLFGILYSLNDRTMGVEIVYNGFKDTTFAKNLYQIEYLMEDLGVPISSSELFNRIKYLQSKWNIIYQTNMPLFPNPQFTNLMYSHLDWFFTNNFTNFDKKIVTNCFDDYSQNIRKNQIWLPHYHIDRKYKI